MGKGDRFHQGEISRVHMKSDPGFGHIGLQTTGTGIRSKSTPSRQPQWCLVSQVSSSQVACLAFHVTFQHGD